MPELILLLVVSLVLLLIITSAMIAWEARHPRRRTTAYAVARGWPLDPGEIGLRFEAWSLDCADGAQLPVWEIDASSRAAQGANPATNPASSSGERRDSGLAIVLIHGWAQSKIDMLLHREPWLSIADRIIMYDLRGHGESLANAARLGDGDDSDLLEIIARLDADRVLLVGHSLGSVVALRAAARWRELESDAKLVGIICYGAYRNVHTPIRGRLRAQQFPARPISDLVMLWLRLSGIRHVDPLAGAAAIECPVLLLHGELDRISPVEESTRIAESLANARVELVHDAGHSDVAFVDPEQHARTIESFVCSLCE